MQEESSDKPKKGDEFAGGDNFFGQMRAAGVADEDFIREIVEMFLDEGRQNLNMLRNAFEKRDKKETYLFAHKLKSSFLMFDMMNAYNYAVKLENMSENEFEEHKKTIKSLEETCLKNFDMLKDKYLK